MAVAFLIFCLLPLERLFLDHLALNIQGVLCCKVRNVIDRARIEYLQLQDLILRQIRTNKYKDKVNTNV